MNYLALLQGAKTVASHPITKGGSLAALISGGLYAASFAGVIIPGWAFTVGPMLGYLAYKVLPKNVEDQIDDVATKVVDVATTIPNSYSEPTDYPHPPPIPTPNNLNKG